MNKSQWLAYIRKRDLVCTTRLAERKVIIMGMSPLPPEYRESRQKERQMVGAPRSFYRRLDLAEWRAEVCRQPSDSSGMPTASLRRILVSSGTRLTPFNHSSIVVPKYDRHAHCLRVGTSMVMPLARSSVTQGDFKRLVKTDLTSLFSVNVLFTYSSDSSEGISTRELADEPTVSTPDQGCTVLNRRS
jgi:hypothetical protein